MSKIGNQHMLIVPIRLYFLEPMRLAHLDEAALPNAGAQGAAH